MPDPGMESERRPSRLTRREALGYLWLASLAAVAGVSAWFGQRFARPQPVEGRAGGTFVVPIADVPSVGGAPYNEAAGRFWLVNTASGALALSKSCTHLECLCEWDGQAREFVCPCHGSRFAEDGRHLDGPATRGLDRYLMAARDSSSVALAETDPSAGCELPLPGQVVELIIDTGMRIPGPSA